MFILCYFCVFGILCVMVFWGYCYFMLSVPVQLIARKDRPRNDQLCVERDIKQLLTHSLTVSSVRSPAVDEERLKPDHWLWSVLCVSFSALTLLVG